MYDSSPARRFRRAKYADYFARLDRNDNGVLEREDFATYVAAIADVLGEADARTLDRLRAATGRLWATLVTTLDVDGNRAVDLGELLAAFSRAALEAANDGEIPRWARDHAVATFDVLDVDGDGVIDVAEYGAYLSALGSPADAAEAFARLDEEGRGALRLEDVEARYREWLLLGDPDSPGNVLLTGQLPER